MDSEYEEEKQPEESAEPTMRSSLRKFFTYILVLALFKCVVSEKVQVKITNRLGGGTLLTIHCQSKDNDLGPQTVAEGGQYGWEFTPNWFGTTLFYCDMAWEGAAEFHFDAYSYRRDWKRCESECFWLVATEGMYGLNDGTGLWEFMYEWPQAMNTYR